MGVNDKGGVVDGKFDCRIFGVKNCSAYSKAFVKVKA
jgi:hypothetical protein